MLWIRRIKRVLIYGTLALGIIWVGLFLFLAPALPDLSDLRTMRKSPGITIVAADGSTLTVAFDKAGMKKVVESFVKELR